MKLKPRYSLTTAITLITLVCILLGMGPSMWRDYCMFQAWRLENQLEQLDEELYPYESELSKELEGYRTTLIPRPTESDLKARAAIENRLLLIESDPGRKTYEDKMTQVRADIFAWYDRQNEPWWTQALKDRLFAVCLSVFALLWAAYIYFRTHTRKKPPRSATI